MSTTFEQFRASRREVAKLSTVISGFLEHSQESAGYVYTYGTDDFYIERDGDSLHLILGAQSEYSDHISALPEFERHLYEYAHAEAIGD